MKASTLITLNTNKEVKDNITGIDNSILLRLTQICQDLSKKHLISYEKLIARFYQI